MTEQNNEYKPTLKEIAGQMGKDVVNVSYKLGKFGKEFVKDFGESFLRVSVLPYMLPNLFRNFEGIEEDFLDSAGGLIGISSGFFSYAPQVFGYYSLCHKGHPEILLLPVATNVASGLYKLARSAKERMADRKSNSLDLENKIEGGKIR